MIIDATYLATLNAAQLVGVAGFFVYLTVFAAQQLNLLSGSSATFSVGNIVAASLVAISLTADFNLASALIQGSWIVIGLIGLVLRLNASPAAS